MPDLPRLATKIVRFYWAKVGNLDAQRRSPVVEVEVTTEDGPVRVLHEVQRDTFEARRYTAIRSPLVGVLAQDAAQAFVDARREKIRALFG